MWFGFFFPPVVLVLCPFSPLTQLTRRYADGSVCCMQGGHWAALSGDGLIQLNPGGTNRVPLFGGQISHSLSLCLFSRWQWGTGRILVPFLPPSTVPQKGLFVLLAKHSQGKSMLPRLLLWLPQISNLEGSARCRRQARGSAVLLQLQGAGDYRTQPWCYSPLPQIFRAAPAGSAHCVVAGRFSSACFVWRTASKKSA